MGLDHPTQVAVDQSGVDYVQVSATTQHNCGLDANDQAYCWSRNFAGGLGDGTTTDRPTPVEVDQTVDSGISLVQVVAGNRYTCGVTAAGDVYCWGKNDDGQLGDGSTTNRLVPTKVGS